MSFRNLSICGCLLSLIIVPSMSCRKLLDVPPPQNQVSTATVFANDTNALNALSGLYIQMMDNVRGLMNGGLTVYGGLSADELVNTSPNIFEDPFRTNTLSPDNLQNATLYNAAYLLIHTANTLLAGLDGSPGISVSMKAELRGETKLMRALVYFYLVNDYGAVPLVVSSDYTTSAVLPQSPPADVYRQIVNDLQEAQSLLPTSYITTAAFPNDRTRANRGAATALLARVYLYQGQWAQADSAATAVINNPLYRLEPALDSVFLASSREAIWQLQPVHGNMGTAEAAAFVPMTPVFPPAYVLTNALLASYESGDKRRTYWTARSAPGKFYPVKYKSSRYDQARLEYNMVLRLGEVYLIRAEARTFSGATTAAAADLNVIRARAGLSPTHAADPSDLLPAILQERRLELAAEWGHRWLDLKRSGQADAVLGAAKPGWTPTAVLYPIPASEFQKNPHLIQNAGYQ